MQSLPYPTPSAKDDQERSVADPFGSMLERDALPGQPATAWKPQRSFLKRFLIILGSFLIITLLSWPILFSFDLWVLEDRGSFLHLDELIASHHRLGVDIFYTYGLLPVLLQHLVFQVFGRGFKPMIGLTMLVMVLNALFWAMLLKYFPQQRRWLVAVVLLVPVILIVNPNLPYSLAVLSIMFALLFVLKGRLDVALGVATIGCFCVPSLTLLLTVLLAFLIIIQWSLAPDRRFRSLAASLALGLVVYATLATLLSLVFGYASLVATAIPLAGARFYKEIGYSGWQAFMTFLHPAGYGIKWYLAYYMGSQVTWFILCSGFLFALSINSLRFLLRSRPLTPASNYVLLYSILQFVFIFFIYGSRGQHSLYEGVIASATLLAISTLRSVRNRNTALAVFLAVGVLGETGSVYKTFVAWRTTVRSPETLGLYADPGLGEELAEIVKDSREHKTLVLGYSTGIQNYFPTLKVPDAWCMQRGQLFPWQKREIVDRIKEADVVVEVLRSPSPAVSDDANMQEALNTMRPTAPKVYFRVSTR